MVARKSNDDFIKEVYELVKDEYTFLEPYNKSNIKIEVRHNKCGNVYKISPNSFLRGRRCPKCSGNEAKRKDTKTFKSEVLNLVGDEYTVIGNYVARNVPILMRHNKCGREYYVEPGNFLYKSRCINCYYDSLRLTTTEVKNKILIYLGPEYHLSGEYTSSQKKTTIHHDRCNNDFKARVDDIIQKRSGCPYCSSSRGEDYVRGSLTKLGYTFKEQMKFEGLVDIASLSYDFYIPDISVLIEYQGSQHYYPKTWGGMTKEEAYDRLVVQQRHDDLKRKFANSNGYTLIEIPYKYDTFDKVLNFIKEVL